MICGTCKFKFNLSLKRFKAPVVKHKLIFYGCLGLVGNLWDDSNLPLGTEVLDSGFGIMNVRTLFAQVAIAIMQSWKLKVGGGDYLPAQCNNPGGHWEKDAPQLIYFEQMIRIPIKGRILPGPKSCFKWTIPRIAIYDVPVCSRSNIKVIFRILFDKSQEIHCLYCFKHLWQPFPSGKLT